MEKPFFDDSSWLVVFLRLCQGHLVDFLTAGESALLESLNIGEFSSCLLLRVLLHQSPNRQ
jgi:hypothetical protein